ncbi:hypothetical protein ACQP2F_41775 [Actinoplanes sp. CA-030573]|uniref:hypothetical protein n=1 Tax=Actinoplanes sp. CA-030573 TaxID=3239898 RepID=UPI003D923071
MRRIAIAAGLTAVAVVGVLGGRQLALAGSENAAPGHAFTLSGSVGGLVPGKASALRLTVDNPNAQPIRLASATVTAKAASAACPASLLGITTFSGTPETIVAARGQAVVELTVTLSAQAPDACRRVSFPLTYSGQADQWH